MNSITKSYANAIKEAKTTQILTFFINYSSHSSEKTFFVCIIRVFSLFLGLFLLGTTKTRKSIVLENHHRLIHPCLLCMRARQVLDFTKSFLEYLIALALKSLPTQRISRGVFRSLDVDSQHKTKGRFLFLLESLPF